MPRRRLLFVLPALLLPVLAACGDSPLTLEVQHDEFPDEESCPDDFCTTIEDITVTNDTDFPTLGEPEVSILAPEQGETVTAQSSTCPGSLAPGESCEIEVRVEWQDDGDGADLVVTAGLHRGTLHYGGTPI